MEDILKVGVAVLCGILAAVLLTGIFVLGAWYVEGIPNPLNWEQGTRFFHFVMSLAFGVLGFMAAMDNL